MDGFILMVTLIRLLSFGGVTNSTLALIYLPLLRKRHVKYALNATRWPAEYRSDRTPGLTALTGSDPFRIPKKTIPAATRSITLRNR